MNFLAHFYFERFSSDSERIAGALLPDLLKNVDKNYVFHPHRYEEELLSKAATMNISYGWYRHIEVDKLFHNSPFFVEHSHELRKSLDPILADLPVRASFMGHIALELLLDHLLIRDQVLSVARLYEHLENVNRTVLKNYLQVIGLEDTAPFMKFYEDFISWKYIFEYEDLSTISRPLFNIAKRVWDFEPSPNHHQRLVDALTDYEHRYLHDYKSVFQYIQDNLTDF